MGNPIPAGLLDKLRAQGASGDLLGRIEAGQTNGPAWFATEAVTGIYGQRRDDLVAAGVDEPQLNDLLEVAKARDPGDSCGVLLAMPSAGTGFDAWFLSREGQVLARIHLPWDWPEGPDGVPASGPLPVPPA